MGQKRTAGADVQDNRQAIPRRAANTRTGCALKITERHHVGVRSSLDIAVDV